MNTLSLPPIKQLRQSFPRNLNRGVSSSVWFLSRQVIDFDCYLPTLGMNLQRPLVWSLQQKRDIVRSIFYDLTIPPLTILSRVGKDGQDLLVIIDGKQRLSSILEYLDDGFSVELFGAEYSFSQLPLDYQRYFSHYYLKYDITYDDQASPMSDAELVDWFKLVNFSGTVQDENHLKSLSERVKTLL